MMIQVLASLSSFVGNPMEFHIPGFDSFLIVGVSQQIEACSLFISITVSLFTIPS